jgi:hypothetical protein
MLSTSILFSAANPSLATTAVTESPAELDAVGKISPVFRLKAADIILPLEIAGATATELNNALRADAATAITTHSRWTVDASDQLYALVSTGGAWRTLRSTALAASWNATSTVTLTEIIRDGATSPTSPYTLTLTLTKAATGTPADLPMDTLVTFLRRSTTSALTLGTAGGTILTGTPALTTGWVARALLADGAAASVLPAALDPIAMTMTVNVTPQVGTAIPFSATVSELQGLNVLPSATTEKREIFLTAPGSRSMKFEVYPATLPRDVSVSAALINAFNATPRRLNQTYNSFLNPLPTALSDVLALMDSTPPANIKAGLNGMAKAAVSGAGFVIGDFTTTADTGNLGLVALASDDITSVTWTAEGSILKATGTIGTGRAKEFTCDLNNIEVVNSSTNQVLEFVSADGDAFWVKCVDATGYDTSAEASVTPGDRDALLALQLASLLSPVTTITGSDLKALQTASS